MAGDASKDLSVFLSHSSKDKAFVRNLAEQLRHSNVPVWLDEAEMLPGDTLLEKISEAISKIDFLAVILSANSVNSRWVNHEVKLALQEGLGGRQIEVIPILKEKCDIPEFARGKIWADLSNQKTYTTELLKLVRKIRQASEERLKKSIVSSSGIVILCKTLRSFMPSPRLRVDGIEHVLPWNIPKFLQLQPNKVYDLEVYFRYAWIPGANVSRSRAEVMVSEGERKHYVYKPPVNNFNRGTLMRVDD